MSTDNETPYYLAPNYVFTNPLQVADRYGDSTDAYGNYLFGSIQTLFTPVFTPQTATAWPGGPEMPYGHLRPGHWISAMEPGAARTVALLHEGMVRQDCSKSRRHL
jgi:hypothetical protein